MKGIIFTALNDMIEKRYGLETWDKLLTTIRPASKGIYIAGETYDDHEFFDYIDELAKLKNVKSTQIIEVFGIFLFPLLAANYPIFLPKDITFKDFMKNVDKIIHTEVNKLHPEATLPLIRYEEVSPNRFIIIYQSPRKLCALAIGLTKGAAAHFKVPINVQQPICMHKGADHCRLEVNIEKQRQG